VPECPQDWRLGCRSSGSRPEAPRTVVIGALRTQNALETQAIVKGIIQYFKDIQAYVGIPILIGRQGLFSHPDSVVVEGVLSKDLHLVQPVLGEALMVTPYKLVCMPWGGAGPIKAVFSSQDALRLATVRYKRSHPMEGGLYAWADALQEQVRAERKKAFALRQPASEADRLQSQVLIEVLQIKHSNFPKLPEEIMSKLGDLLNCNSFKEKNEHEIVLAPGDWQPLLREGIWNGKILIQLESKAQRGVAFQAAHGVKICLDGIQASMHVTTPTEGSLAAESLNATTAARLHNS
jgi:hypothetical protein